MGISRFVFIPLLLLNGYVCHSTLPDRTIPPRKAMRSVKDLAVQFSGTYDIRTFSQYDIVFIDPDLSQDSEADTLLQRGVLPIAYVNIGEAEEYRWYYSGIKPEWLLGKNPNWAEHYYIDVNNAAWQQLVLEKILPRIFRKGFCGIFLDMVDIASPDLHPSTREGVVALIAKIRRAYPDKVIIMNDGTFLVDQVSSFIDGICVESVFASYHFSSKTYFLRPRSESEQRCRKLVDIMTRYDTRIFLIDYAAIGDSTTRSFVMAEARRYGFIPFVSTINLDTIQPPVR